MKVELQCGDTIAIPEGCKAVIKDGCVVFEKEQEFNDGDILAYASYSNRYCPFIYKGTDKNGFHKYYIGLDSLSRITLPNCTDSRWGHNTLRHATEEEKKELFDKMKEQGLQWNAEKKRVEKIRWRAGVEEEYYFINPSLDVLKIEECRSVICSEHYLARNYFRTIEQAEEAAKRIKEVLRKYHEEIGE
ncbi:MAG: hypothetical protein HG466_005640 [Prevotella sp.]|nr:hypothetical protein [Prevotella sp.]